MCLLLLWVVVAVLAGFVVDLRWQKKAIVKRLEWDQGSVRIIRTCLDGRIDELIEHQTNLEVAQQRLVIGIDNNVRIANENYENYDRFLHEMDARVAAIKPQIPPPFRIHTKRDGKTGRYVVASFERDHGEGA